MRIAPGTGSLLQSAARLAALALAGAMLGACTISGPATLGETGTLAGAKPSAPAAPRSTAAAPAIDPAARAAAAGALPAAPAAPARVALLLPLTGPPQVAAIAKGMKQAGELALFDLDNPMVQLIVKDDKGTAEGARAAAEEALREGAELILGPLLSGSVAAAAQPARVANVPLVAFSNDNQVAGNGVHLLSFHANAEIDRVVAHATGQSRKRFAGLFPPGPYGASLEQAFSAAITRGGGALLAREATGGDSLLEPVQRLAAAIQAAEAEGGPIDALVVPGGHQTMAEAAPLLASNGVDLGRIKLIGTGGWDLPGVTSPALAGAWFAAPDPRGWRDFAARFARTYGTPPPRLATLAYDGVGIAAALASGPPRGRYSPASLTRASGFTGADGQFRLLPGAVAERALAVLELEKLGVNVVDPAPSSLGHARLTATANPD